MSMHPLTWKWWFLTQQRINLTTNRPRVGGINTVQGTRHVEYPQPPTTEEHSTQDRVAILLIANAIGLVFVSLVPFHPETVWLIGSQLPSMILARHDRRHISALVGLSKTNIYLSSNQVKIHSVVVRSYCTLHLLCSALLSANNLA